MKKKEYDKDSLIPVIRQSICTGEKVFGFEEIKTHRFHEIILIRNDRDLKNILNEYGIDIKLVKIIY